MMYLNGEPVIPVLVPEPDETFSDGDVESDIADSE